MRETRKALSLSSIFLCLAFLFTFSQSALADVQENFGSMPTWSSSFDASWGSAATWSIQSGGQSGSCLRAVRSSGGSSAKVSVYSVPTNTNLTISIYMQCPSMSNYWMESAYKLGSYTAENFDQDGGSWTLIQKFDSYGSYPNGNGNTWTQYSKSINSGSNSQVSIGYKIGSSGNGTSNVHWDTLLISWTAGDTATHTPTNTPTNTPDPGNVSVVVNGDFEGGFTNNVGNGWNSWIDTGWDTASFADGTDRYVSAYHSQKMNAGQPPYNKTMGIYQMVNTAVNGTYTFYVSHYHSVSESYGCENMELFMALDPYGTYNKSGYDVEWHQLSCTKDQWITQNFSVVAKATKVTIYLEVRRKWAQGGNGYAWFDNVSVSGPPPDPTYTPTVTVTATPTQPPPVGPELVTNGNMENFTSGLANSWSSWSTNGTGYWKQSTLVGKSGGGNYHPVIGWYEDMVAMNAKTYLLGMGYGPADSLQNETHLQDSIVVGRLTMTGDKEEQIYYGDYQAVAIWLANHYQTEAGYHPRVDAWLGQNEPDWTLNWQRTRDFEIYFTQQMHQRKLQTVVLNMAVGTPGDIYRMLDCKDLFEICDYYGHHVYGGPNDQLMILPTEENWAQDNPYLYALRCRQYEQMYRDRGWRFPPVIYTEGTTYSGWHSNWVTSAQVRDDLIAMIPYMNADRWNTGLCIFVNGGTGAWADWDVTGYGICAPVGQANNADPADKTSGLYSQMFGVGDLHCRTGGCNRNGVFTGGIVQAVSGLAYGESHLLEFDFKWARSNGTANLTFTYGLDWTGQTSNPNAGTIAWSSDLINLYDLPHQIFKHHYDVFTAQASTVSVWFKVHQNLSDVPIRIALDSVSLRQVSGSANPTNTFTPTNTRTNTPTNTRTNTPTNTRTNTPTNTRTNTFTNTPTRTFTNTATNTRTNTPTNTRTNTPTNTRTNTPTNTRTNTATNTRTNTPTHTPTNAPSNNPPTIVGSSMSATYLLADDSTQYTVTVTAEDTNGVNDLRSIRAMFHNGGSFSSANGRGYLAWGQVDADITYWDSYWTISNSGGSGRWGWNNQNYGSNTYITPVSATTSTNGNQRTVTWTFRVKGAWAPAVNQKLRVFAHDTAIATTGWIETASNYSVNTYQNLALKAVTYVASSQYSASYQGRNALDGVYSSASRWVTQNDSSTNTLVVDLGSVCTVKQYRVYQPSYIGEPSTYNLIEFYVESGSSLQGSWTQRWYYNNPNQNENMASSTHSTPITARYFRLRIVNSGIDNYVRLPEFEIHGGSGTLGTIRFEAEDYEGGRQAASGTDYYDTDTGNTGGQYRTQNVDIENCSEGGWNVGWIANTEWIQFPFKAPAAGNYQVRIRHAGTANGTCRVNVAGTDKTGSISLPSTGGWQTWTTTTGPTFSVSAGFQWVRFRMTSAGYNVNYFEFVPQ